ncbi:hypothetical protein [Actinotalea sp.]|uniref:hypothetical protein n=1 Tax=Actinotalea sp. TaxID=1872145 RepID=UPI003569AA1A
MTDLSAAARAALAPVRSALAAAAEAEAAAIAEAAHREAARRLGAAHEQAARILTAAAAQGAESARASAAQRSARARREAHELVLAAQSELRGELMAEVVALAQRRAGDPDHADWQAELAERCREILGPAVTVAASPDGGVVGTLGSRRLDLSIPVLAAELLDASGAQVRALWAP